jgi:hypothetical protein
MTTKAKKPGAKAKRPGRAKAPAKKPAHRPSDYSPEYADQVKSLCAHGFTDKELADHFGVHVSTLYRWQHAHPDFRESLKSGRDFADERVERSLYHRAVGYSFKAEKVFQFQGEIVRAATIEHVPPDTTAGIFWLKNRRPEQWRDKQVMEHDGKLTLEQLVLQSFRSEQAA